MPPSTKLNNAPLVQVLAQVRYAPVLTISRVIPRIQEGLKNAGFPRFEKSEAANVVLNPGAAPRIDTIERWDFLSRDKRTGFVLTPSSVAIHTNEYDTFQAFSVLLQEALVILAAEAKIEIVERIGIRYVDLVRLEESEEFADYLKPGLVGFPFPDIADVPLTNSASMIHSVAQLAGTSQSSPSTLTIKCLQADNGSFLPPDLLPPVLHYDLQLKPGEMVAILDFDHFSIVDIDFDPQLLVARLDKLHEVANKAFRIALQPLAYKKWGGQVI